MFSDIDFKSGEISWCTESLEEEDILSVKYPNNYSLLVGWYSGRFNIEIIRDRECGVPVATYRTKDKNKLLLLLQQAVCFADEESRKSKPYYGELWKTKIIEL